MATSDVDAAHSKASSGTKQNSGTTGLLDHLAALRLGSAQRVFTEIGQMFSLIRQNFFGLYFTTTVVSTLARALNVLALAGTIKVAALILFNWKGALEIADQLGISLAGATKTDVAWIGAGIILTIYLLAGIAGYFSKRTQSKLAGRTERVLYERYLQHPAFVDLSALESFRPAAIRAISTYARSAVSMALIPGLATLCALIVLILALSQPMLIAIVLLAIVPLLLLYLLTGRRASVASALLKSSEARRAEFFRTMTPMANANKNRKQPTEEEIEHARAEVLRLTADISDQRMRVKSIQSAPEAALALVAGSVLAAAIIVLAGTPTDSNELIYLLIGFILIRFMFVYLKVAFSQLQSIVQNLDDIRFINQTILSDTIAADAVPPRSRRRGRRQRL